VHLIAEGMPEEFQQHWAGTHFFNPPRYLKWWKSFRTEDLEGSVDSLSEFCDGGWAKAWW